MNDNHCEEREQLSKHCQNHSEKQRGDVGFISVIKTDPLIRINL